MQLAGCSGSLFVFQSTVITVATCRKAEEASGLATCGLQGTAYYNIDCAARYIVDTPSSRITVKGTAFSVTFLPESSLTLVAVFEGQVQLQPVMDSATGELGKSIPVAKGHYLYTMPGEASPEVAGKPARQALPMEDLPPLIDELDIWSWMEGVAGRAKGDGVLPTNWSAGGETNAAGRRDVAGEAPALTVNLGMAGGALNDGRVRDAVLAALPTDNGVLSAFQGEDVELLVSWRDEVIEARGVAYDPEMAKALLDESGYGEGFQVTLGYPEGDDQLMATAGILAEYLTWLGIEVQPEAVAESTALDALSRMMPSTTARLASSVQQPVMWLVRR
jgi:hypothetical protein